MTTESRPPVAPGESAPDFTLPAADRPETVSLGDYRGRSPVFLALFVGLWCPFCRRSIAQMGKVESKLKALGRFIWDTYRHNLKVFVDTAPLMEKPAAQAVGHGWQGKHTNLVSRQFGSWLFLGEILLSVELPADQSETDHCGQCRACLDICPTKAFPAPYRLEARRCISYLTIEHEGPIDRELRPLLGNRIYGCDDCLAVCPWNKFAQEARETALMPRPALNAPLLAELATLDDAAFRKRFAGTAVKRIGRDRFLRNVAYALGNSGAPATSRPAIEHLLADSSPLVRGAAVWALSRLAPDQVAQRERAPREDDAGVRAEWQDALNAVQGRENDR